MRNVRWNLAVSVAALLCALSLAACGGGSGGDTGGGGSGNNNGSGVIGSTGGTVSLPSGPTVVVPPGALTTSTTITVAASSIAAPAGAVSSAYQFGPEGTIFSTPVTVSFPVPAGTTAANVAVYWTKPGSTTQWDVLPAMVSGTTATASVTHFSAGFVGAACAPGAACTPTNVCHTGTTTCNGTPTCVDTGTSVTDGAACGNGNVCTAGVCGSAQCIDMSGVWTITSHCDPAYVGKSVVLAQTGCTVTTNDPVTGDPRTLQVNGSSITLAPSCSGTVSGTTWTWTCGTCAQTLVRQAQCVPNVTCTPPGTPDVCKTYATSCDAGGVQTCGATGNRPDGTPCGTGFTCVAGTCGPIPSAPTGVAAQAGNGQVTLSWDAVAGATTYNVYWSNDAGVTPANGTKVAGVTTPWVHTGLVAGGTYFYVVSAVSGTSESAPSSQVSATPFATPGTLSISGSVTGPWVEGVTLVLGGTRSATTVTDSTGHYAFQGLPAGSYTLTPSLAGYAYVPATAQVPLSVNDTLVNFTASPNLPSYSISGTVSYAGSKTGRTYVMAKCTSVPGCVVSHHPGKGGSPTAATSIPTSGGAYTIRGLAPGTYALSAAIDTQGSGFFNGTDPSGTSTFTITSGNLTGVNIAVTDPVNTAPLIPTITQVLPGDGGAMVHYAGRHWGASAATSYRLYWGTDPAATTGTPMTFPVGQSEDMPWFFHAGLTNGQALYYRLSALNPIGESATSPVVGPVTIGSTGGGSSTVSGTLTLPVPATGPLLVTLFDFSTGFGSGVAIPTPTSTTVPYSLAGVPDGTSLFFSFVDMNRDGVMGVGDAGGFLGNCGDFGSTSFVTVSGNTRYDGALNAAAAAADVLTHHYRSISGSPDTYTVTTMINGHNKLPVAATLYSGPGAAVPLDMTTNQMNLQVQCGWAGFSRAGTRPSIGDTYRYQVAFSDGTSGIITGSVNSVLDSFAQNLGQTTSAPYSRNVPLLTWVAPASPPPDYSYTVSVTGPDNSWYYYGPDGTEFRSIPSTTTSVPFNVDGHAQRASLTTGVTYTYEVEVRDRAGNSALYRTTYTP